MTQNRNAPNRRGTPRSARRRLLVSAGAAAAVAVSALTGQAHAASAATDPTPNDTVVLPTGDRVTVLPNGVATIDPAEGREGMSFLMPTATGVGDRIVVPLDMAEAVADGEEDPRRYNITQLLASGQYDAASAPESELDDRAYDGLVPAAETVAEPRGTAAAQELTVTFRDRSGGAPEGGRAFWVSADGTESGRIELDATGRGTVALEPGDYHLQTEFWNRATDTERGEFVAGFPAVTVGDAPTRLVVDANDALPVNAEVERPDVRQLDAVYTLRWYHENFDLAIGTHLSAEYDAFLLSGKALPGWAPEFFYQPTLADPALTHVYNLAFHERGSLPDEPSFAVKDAELAELEVTYQSLGVDGLTGRACDYGELADGGQPGLGTCRSIDTPVPSTRTVHYTADPEITWDRTLRAGTTDDEGRIDNGFLVTGKETLEPGEDSRTMTHGPLAAVPPVAFRSEEDGTAELRFRDIGPGALNGEKVLLLGFRGDAVLSRDGQEVGRAQDVDFYWDGLSFAVPADAGRYTLTAEGKHGSEAMLFGAEAHMAWTFDSAPSGEELEGLPLPVVALRTDGVEGGYAERGTSLDVTLDLVVDEQGGPPTHAVDMTFEVSYDDGETWQEVAIDRDGDTATAQLRLPDAAGFASVRTTALDDRGTEVSHTTYRSFGLR